MISVLRVAGLAEPHDRKGIPLRRGAGDCARGGRAPQMRTLVCCAAEMSITTESLDTLVVNKF